MFSPAITGTVHVPAVLLLGLLCLRQVGRLPLHHGEERLRALQDLLVGALGLGDDPAVLPAELLLVSQAGRAAVQLGLQLGRLALQLLAVALLACRLLGQHLLPPLQLLHRLDQLDVERLQGGAVLRHGVPDLPAGRAASEGGVTEETAAEEAAAEELQEREQRQGAGGRPHRTWKPEDAARERTGRHAWKGQLRYRRNEQDDSDTEEQKRNKFAPGGRRL